MTRWSTFSRAGSRHTAIGTRNWLWRLDGSSCAHVIYQTSGGRVQPTRLLAKVDIDAPPSRRSSSHPLSRELRIKVVLFGFAILQGSVVEATVEYNFRDAIYDAAFSWFKLKPG
jgi:hypothetical protein